MIVDLFLVYQMIKRLATPFNEWEAYKLGIIDEKGNPLKKRKELTRIKERDAWGIFDIMIAKLKRLLEKVPGGQTRLGSYAAALWLIKENSDIQKNGETLTEEQIEEKLTYYMTYVEEQMNLDLDALFEKAFEEEAPANAVGGGHVAGLGVGPQGEPGITSSQMKRYKNKNKKRKKFRDMIGTL